MGPVIVAVEIMRPTQDEKMRFIKKLAVAGICSAVHRLGHQQIARRGDSMPSGGRNAYCMRIWGVRRSEFIPELGDSATNRCPVITHQCHALCHCPVSTITQRRRLSLSFSLSLSLSLSLSRTYDLSLSLSESLYRCLVAL